MEKRIRKGCAGIVANVIRQIALTELKSLRPIAIRVGNESNVISAGNSVLEDMLQICSSLNVLGYTSNSSAEILEFRTVVTGTLMASQLQSDEFSVVLPDGRDVEIMHVLNDSVEVVIYFKNCNGVCTKDDNIYTLTKEGFNTDKLVVVNSRHTDITNFSYSISDDTDNATDLVDFSIESRISNKADFQKELFNHSVEILKEILDEL